MNTFRRLLLLTAFATAAFGQTGIARSPLTIAISTQTPTIKLGDPLLIDIQVTNVSDSEVDTSDAISHMTGQNSNFLFDVRDAKGKQALKRAYEHEELATWKVVPLLLKPQESSTDPIDVSRLYNLVSSTYSIQVTRRLPSGGYVTSKSIIVEVTEP